MSELADTFKFHNNSDKAERCPHDEIEEFATPAHLKEDHNVSPLLDIATGPSVPPERQPLRDGPIQELCPIPDCGHASKDLTAHMLTHQTEPRSARNPHSFTSSQRGRSQSREPDESLPSPGVVRVLNFPRRRKRHLEERKDNPASWEMKKAIMKQGGVGVLDESRRSWDGDGMPDAQFQVLKRFLSDLWSPDDTTPGHQHIKSHESINECPEYHQGPKEQHDNNMPNICSGDKLEENSGDWLTSATSTFAPLESSEVSEYDTLLDGSECSDYFSGTESQPTDRRDRSSPTLKSFGLQVITSLRLELQALFDGVLHYRSHPVSSSSDGRARTGTKRTPNSSQPRPSGSKRTTAEQRSESANDSQDEVPDKKPRLTLPSGSIHAPLCSKLACPFFKNNLAKYQSWRTCPGPGWDSVHRVKEHIYRRHASRPVCPRCGIRLEDEESVAVHSKNPIPCSPGEPEEEDGCSVAQAKMLRSRKGIKGMTEVERWQQAYRILFPECVADSVPSPFYDDDEEQEFRRLVKFKDYLKDELPRKLCEDMASDSEPLPEWLQLQIGELARRATEKAFEAYQRPPASPPQTPKETIVENDIRSTITPKSTPTHLPETLADIFSTTRSDLVTGIGYSTNITHSDEKSRQPTEEGPCEHTEANTLSGKHAVNDILTELRHQEIDEFSTIFSSLPGFDFDLDQWQVPEIFR